MNALIEKWEAMTEKHTLLEFIHIMLMGVSQVTLNTNPICAVILLIAVGVASPLQLLTCLWSLFIATLLVYALGIPKVHAKEGLYTINPALAGIAVPMVTYVNNAAFLPQILLFTTIISVLCILLTAALRRITATWQVSPLAIPFSIALALISSSTYYLSALRPAPMFTPSVVELLGAGDTAWNFSDLITAVLNGIAQVMWIEDVPRSAIAGIIVLIGILVASRIDFLIAIYTVILATATAVLSGIGQGGIMLGLYGYGAILLSFVLFGRAYKMSPQSFLMITVLSIVGVFFTAGMKPLFAVVGAPVSAFAWSGIAILAMLGRKYFTKLDYMLPMYWKTPESSKNAPVADTEGL